MFRLAPNAKALCSTRAIDYLGVGCLQSAGQLLKPRIQAGPKRVGSGNPFDRNVHCNCWSDLCFAGASCLEMSAAVPTTLIAAFAFCGFCSGAVQLCVKY
jgi:hypothetical protein